MSDVLPVTGDIADEKQPVRPHPGEAGGQAVKLEFPYDDLYLLYEYALKELGIADPFK